ncbi:ABC transporter permease [Kribbella albertanoniae]|uniref:ABC transporter permease n=1 Tax=Kribbella albertanoniae TaxID=1266829 RepID=A0A4R4Q4H2_9ACTN|nr:ABC transporter permease [Kribbella albertanoniae]TDC29954.1 ABC transporter permease [Kribbella albertanoniae]
MADLEPGRLSPADLARVGLAGLRARPVRVVLSALGIAIGIAAMVAVVGISTSSRADLNRQLQALGTNLLMVGPGQNLFGEDVHLPTESVAMVDRIQPVTAVSAVGAVPEVSVYRTDKVPPGQTGGIQVVAAQIDLLPTIGAESAAGTFLNAATAQYPAVVLGAQAAQHLGAVVGQQVYLGTQWFTVVGLLRPAPLAPELDNAALVGWPVAKALLGFDGYPTTIYARAVEDDVTAVQKVLAATAKPEAPNEVDVSRPSDALAAQQAADATLDALLLGLGAVALLAGGVGVANTMVVSVLERRGEIGLRRALGATRHQIRSQFLTEALLLSGLGGLGGALLGTLVTVGYATTRGWSAVVPVWALLGGLVATAVIGVLAGLYPAVQAARLAPTEALSAPV